MLKANLVPAKDLAVESTQVKTQTTHFEPTSSSSSYF